LEDLKVLDICILGVDVEFDPAHRQILYGTSIDTARLTRFVELLYGKCCHIFDITPP
jgi:hypothetical protein